MVKNGAIPTRQLAKVDATHYAAPGCVIAFRAWSVRMVQLGYPALTAGTAADSCYRSLAWQQARWAIFQRYGRPVAAYPGTSNHGLGMAIDIGNYYRYPHSLLVREGRRYGFRFDTPSENWHVRYIGTPKYKSLTPPPAPVTEEDDDMRLIYNTKTRQYGVFTPSRGVNRITATEASEYARILKVFRDTPNASLSQVRENLSDPQWSLLARDYGITS